MLNQLKSFLFGISQQKEVSNMQNSRFTIAIIGDKNVGKTSLCRYLCGINEKSHNIGNNFYTKSYFHGQNEIKIVFDEYNQIDYIHYKYVFIVFDHSNPDTFGTLPEYISHVKLITVNTKIIIIGNKFDLKNPNNQIDMNIIRNYNVPYYDISCKDINCTVPIIEDIMIESGFSNSIYISHTNIVQIEDKLTNASKCDLRYILSILRSDRDIEIAIMINKFPMEHDNYKILHMIRTAETLFEIYNWFQSKRIHIPKNVLYDIQKSCFSDERIRTMAKLILNRKLESEEYEILGQDLIDFITHRNEKYFHAFGINNYIEKLCSWSVEDEMRLVEELHISVMEET